MVKAATGGNNQSLGRAGEFLAASIFEQHGVLTTHVDVYGSDLWCETPSGRRVTVQVKTTLRPVLESQHTTPRYAFNLPVVKSCLPDVYCLVALEDRLLRLFSSSEVTNRGVRRRLSLSEMTEELMLADLNRYLY